MPKPADTVGGPAWETANRRISRPNQGSFGGSVGLSPGSWSISAWRMVGVCGSTASSWRVCIPWTVLRNSRGRIPGRASRSAVRPPREGQRARGPMFIPVKDSTWGSESSCGCSAPCSGQALGLMFSTATAIPGRRSWPGLRPRAWVRRCWRLWACGGRLGHSCSSATCFLIIAGHSGAEPGRVRLAERCWAAWLLCL